MGAAMGMLGTTSRLGYYAAAGDFAFSGAAGATSGGVSLYLNQYKRHKEWLEKHTQ
ncbi:hypothetical protein [Fodinibius saliphilus]|uniref:hypothetical protein n=1 Tax=Fodinibius saliphilus TaxID=1920650 RepID=UPI00148711A4|nr:hypothetical protein [Fodinibius saliphilus]